MRLADDAADELWPAASGFGLSLRKGDPLVRRPSKGDPVLCRLAGSRGAGRQRPGGHSLNAEVAEEKRGERGQRDSHHCGPPDRPSPPSCSLADLVARSLAHAHPCHLLPHCAQRAALITSLHTARWRQSTQHDREGGTSRAVTRRPPPVTPRHESECLMLHPLTTVVLLCFSHLVATPINHWA